MQVVVPKLWNQELLCAVNDLRPLRLSFAIACNRKDVLFLHDNGNVVSGSMICSVEGSEILDRNSGLCRCGDEYNG